jgi:hypothetical protein
MVSLSIVLMYASLNLDVFTIGKVSHCGHFSNEVQADIPKENSPIE